MSGVVVATCMQPAIPVFTAMLARSPSSMSQILPLPQPAVHAGRPGWSSRSKVIALRAQRTSLLACAQGVFLGLETGSFNRFAGIALSVTGSICMVICTPRPHYRPRLCRFIPAADTTSCSTCAFLMGCGLIRFSELNGIWQVLGGASQGDGGSADGGYHMLLGNMCLLANTLSMAVRLSCPGWGLCSSRARHCLA